MDIVIAGPGKNALSTALLESLRDQIEAAGNEPLFVYGEGDVFSAGLNLKEILAADEAAMLHFFDLLNRVVGSLFRHPAPTVACVTGHAIAGGAIVARACDVAIGPTHEKVKIGLNETALGLPFPPPLLRMMVHRLPRRYHTRVFLEGTLFNPQQACEVGFLDDLANKPIVTARERFEALSKLAGPAYADNKAQLLGEVGLVDPAERERFAQDVLPVWISPELKARIAAMFDK
ncbi:MAG: enoyl-CoA hydratase/isomerase family protein [Myxococcota bacterium]